MNHLFHIGDCFRDRYRITKVLAEGRLSITYKVIEYGNTSNQLRVMKQLKKPTISEFKIDTLRPEEQQKMFNDSYNHYIKTFKREVLALEQLGKTYRQIPEIIDKFDDQDEHFFVQEFIEGCSLDEEIKSNTTISEKNTVKLLTEILEILEHIQNSDYPVIHRDIKPANIIRRSTDKKLVLIDFRLVEEVIIPGIGDISVVEGTLGYTAPEIYARKVSFASDIYSVGMIGIFAITGKAPHTFNNSELAKNWQNSATVSSKFAAFLRKMVCQSYKERFQNASEALAELRNLDQSVSPLHKILITLNSIVSNTIIASGVGLLGFIVLYFVSSLTHRSGETDTQKIQVEKLVKTYTHPDTNMQFTIKYPDEWMEKPIQLENEEKFKLSPKNVDKKDGCPLELSVNAVDLGKSLTLLEYTKNVAGKKIHDDPSNTTLQLSDQAKLNNYEDAYQIIYKRKENNQCTLKLLERGTLFHKKAYYIIYKSPDREYDKYKPIVEKIMDSFEIN